MSKLALRFHAALASAVTLAATLVAVAPPARAASPAGGESQLDVYQDDQGGKYFALSLKPSVSVPAAASRDVAIVFDTSASQTGVYREKALEALDGLLSGLAPGDRVQLIAADLKAVPLTTGFVGVDSPELKKGLEKLRRRAPLGTTDMPAVLSSLSTAFDGATAPRAAVYIGDAVSNPGISSETFASAVDNLVKSRIPVTNYAIGPSRNEMLLAALANQTGGQLYLDADELSGKQVGS